MVMDYGVLTCFRHFATKRNRTQKGFRKCIYIFGKRRKRFQNFCDAKVEVERGFRRRGDSIAKHEILKGV